MSSPILLNDAWRFYLGDDPGADFMGYDDAAWRVVNLPHDWSVEHPFDRGNASGTGYLPGGTAWYRKHFVLPEEAEGKRVRITFGGVYKHARVWINSNYLGTRAYGYSTFTYDISAFVHPGENVVCVRVEHNEVADSRWFTGSGIYRDVTLEISDPCSFETDGIFVTTAKVEDGKAQLLVKYETAMGEEAAFAVAAPDGTVVAEGKCSGACGETELVVGDPQLWSCDTPVLYTLTGCVLKGGEVKDVRQVRFGIRTFVFDCNKGFFLNGVGMKLKGVCVHHDAGTLGAAVPREVWERRLRVFRESGCNAIRTAHNPPDPLLLDLCDEMGFLVMDEAFDEWEGAKNKWWQGHNVYPPKRFGYAEDFPQWYRIDLEGMVKRDRNHPSIILWSIGNEIDYPNDPYVTPVYKEVVGNNDANKPEWARRYDPRRPDAGRLAVLAKELTEIVHGVDTSRPVISAMSFPELSTRTGYADALDVSGYNYRERFYEEDHKRFPDRVLMGSENGHNVEAWYAVRDNDYISAQFLWTGIDFLGECRGWPLRISQAGMVNLAGYPKPMFYMRKAMWCNEPFVKLAAGGESIREQRLAWYGTPGETQTVCVYTNQPEAELFVNGVSMGVQPVTDYKAAWQVPYVDGSVEAVSGACRDCLMTPAGAEQLILAPDHAEVPADGRSVVQVEVTLADQNGIPAAGQDTCVHYQLLGDARLLGIENGRPDDLTPYAETYRTTLDGRAIVYVAAGRRAGTIRLHAYTDNGLEADIQWQQG